MHLNEEQFEDALRDPAPHAEHLAACKACRLRLEAHRALSARLRKAMAGTQTPAELLARVRQGLPIAATRAPRPLYVRLMPALAAAAAVLLIAVPLTVYFLSANHAQAAQMELTQIHEGNLSGKHSFYSEDDPAKLAAYLKKELHFSPAMPKPGQGLAMRGCCVAHFRNGVAGSYVVDTPSGPMSIIVVRDDPQALGLKDNVARDGRTYYLGAYARNNLATVRLGEFTYCAVANNDVNPDKLIDLLGRLVN